MELGNDVVVAGKVTVAASTPSLAFSGVLALEAEFIAGRVLGDYIVSSPRPVSLVL